MFSLDCKENQENLVHLQDFDSDIVKEMLHFIYTDKVDNLDELAYDLLIAADKYNLEKLKKICAKHLITTITSDNTGDVLAVADIANCERLKQKTIEYIVSNPKNVSETESWDNMVSKRPFLYKDAFNALAKKQKVHE